MIHQLCMRANVTGCQGGPKAQKAPGRLCGTAFEKCLIITHCYHWGGILNYSGKSPKVGCYILLHTVFHWDTAVHRCKCKWSNSIAIMVGDVSCGLSGLWYNHKSGRWPTFIMCIHSATKIPQFWKKKKKVSTRQLFWVVDWVFVGVCILEGMGFTPTSKYWFARAEGETKW